MNFVAGVMHWDQPLHSDYNYSNVTWFETTFFFTVHDSQGDSSNDEQQSAIYSFITLKCIGSGCELDCPELVTWPDLQPISIVSVQC